MGAVLHAYNGIIEIEEGATVGAGVLVVGQAKIAAQASIGALTTVVSANLEAEQTVPAGSILGDTSRKIPELSASISASTTETTPSGATAAATTPTNEVEEEEQAKAEQSHYVSPGSGDNTETTPSGTAATSPTNEEEEQAKAEQSHYVSPGGGYNTVIQPKPISIPQTATITNSNIEAEEVAPPKVEEEEATAPTEPEAGNGQDVGSTEQSQYVSPGPRYHTFIQPKPVSIPGTAVNGQDANSTVENGALLPAAETEAPESEEEEKQKPPTPKQPVAGLDYVQSMMKTLFPHKNISLAREDEED
jgi:carbonic anhydrase/acetyltransferase-like protein (isoleucine patch superfamily)